MNIKKILTPKDTEEIRPGIFVQKNKKGENRVINPIVWNDKWNLKKQFSIKTLITLAIIIFVVWSYQHDVKQYQEFFNNVTSNPGDYCDRVLSGKQNPLGGFDIPFNNSMLKNIEVINGKDSNFIQGNT